MSGFGREAGVAVSGLFDHSFEHALDESHAGRLDRLEINGREKMDLAPIADRSECLVERESVLE